MKFAKLMGRAEELLPDLRHLCLRYKELKKYLRSIGPDVPTERGSSCQAECDFLELLQEDVQRLNDYFCEKEEEVVIMLQHLDEQTTAAATHREQQLCHVAYIHLHGQIVLLFHWSMLNYTALIKILKKHDKVSGVEMKAPVLANALRQPFSTTGLLSHLMGKCAAKAKELENLSGGLGTLLKNCPQYQGLFLIKETEAALDLWTDLRQNVSTPSTFPEHALVHRVGSSNGMKRKRAASSSGDVECAPLGDGEDVRAPDGNCGLQGATDNAMCNRLQLVAAAAVDALAAMSVASREGYAQQQALHDTIPQDDKGVCDRGGT